MWHLIRSRPMGLVTLLVLFALATPVPAAPIDTPADPWPRLIDLGGATATLHQPQVEGWDGNRIRFRAVVGVSRELLDAARIDGAGALQRVRHIVLPALRNTIVFVVTVTTILAFRVFVQPYLMTRGGPGNRTLSVVQSIYETTFLDQDLGRACAAALLFLLLVGALTLLQRRLSREERG